jgi:uncharacterized protein with GYD domain
MPPLHACLADPPAQIDLAAIDERAEIDQAHAQVLDLDAELLDLRDEASDPLPHLLERQLFLLEVAGLAEMPVAFEPPLDRVHLLLKLGENQRTALDLLHQRSDLGEEAVGLLARKVARHRDAPILARGDAMPLYVLLTKVTSQGIKTIRDNPTRIKDVVREVEQMGARVLAQYATLGRYDFVNIVEAKDDQTIAKVSVNLGARGTVQLETLAAIAIDDFIKGLQPPRKAK